MSFYLILNTIRFNNHYVFKHFFIDVKILAWNYKISVDYIDINLNKY